MKEKIEKVQIVITPKSIFLLLGILSLIVLVYKLSAVLYIFFIAFSIYSSLKPIVTRLEKKNKIQKAISIPLILAIFISVLSSLLILVVQNITIEMKNINPSQLVNNFVEVIEEAVPFIGDREAVDNLENQTEQNIIPKINGDEILSNNLFIGSSSFIFKLLGSTAGVLLSIITIFVVSYYMLLKKGNIFDGLLKFLPDKNTKVTIRKYIGKVENKLGSWLISQFVLMLIIGVMSYVGVALPMVYFNQDIYAIGRFAVTLAVISGFLEVIPTIGPIITFLISIFLSIALGGEYVIPQTIYIGILFIMVQQLEAAMIVPNVMKQAIGLDPIVTILGVLAGGILAGPIGAILIIPLIATAQIVFEFFIKEEEVYNPESIGIESRTNID
ncbi:AI-2E family transporter [Candidatus Dojkabacteria bacterium]|nr:AI-2E family transporter [Candidatus Dojkabacteria bacterium]